MAVRDIFRIFRRKKKKEEEAPRSEANLGADPNAWPDAEPADAVDPNAWPDAWPDAEPADAVDPGAWPDADIEAEDGGESAWPDAEPADAADPGAWPDANVVAEDGRDAEAWPEAPDAPVEEADEPETGKKKKKGKKEKKPKEKKAKKSGKKKKGEGAEGEEGEESGGDGGKKKLPLPVILIPAVAVVAAAAAVVILKPWAPEAPPPDEIVEPLNEEPPDGELQEFVEPSQPRQAAPEQGRGEPLNTADAMRRFESFTPASLGLEGESMSEYRYYATGKTLKVDGIQCREIMVYSENPSAGTNEFEGRFLLSMDSAKLYKEVEDGGILELTPSMIGLGD